jgi:hypothetical protein
MRRSEYCSTQRMNWSAGLGQDETWADRPSTSTLSALMTALAHRAVRARPLPGARRVAAGRGRLPAARRPVLRM